MKMLSDDFTTTLELTDIRELSSSERLRLSLKKSGLFLGLSIISILIPVFHFVLVPLFFFISVWFLIKTLKTKKIIKTEGIKCPKCAHSFAEKEINVQADEDIKLFCLNCRTTYYVSNEK